MARMGRGDSSSPSGTMYHYFYKITNDFDDCFYYGVHSTENLEDNYMGSGLRLWNAYRAHGINHFNKEILEFFEDRNLALAKEKEVVTIELVKNPKCYNLILGGGNNEPTGCVTARFKGTEKWLTIPCEEYWENKDLYETVGTGKVICIEKASGKHISVTKEEFHNNRNLYSSYGEGKILTQDLDGKCYLVNKNDPRFETGKIKSYWSNKQHSKETRLKMRESYVKNQHQQGSKNSNFGKCWITNGVNTKSINKADLEIWLNNGWHQGRIYKDKSNIVKANQDRIWIHKDSSVKFIYKSEAKAYKDLGWKYGRSIRKTINKKKNPNIDFWNNL